LADLKGSTELMRDLDPEEARAVIDPTLKLMMDAVHRYDGYVVQSTGDGIFALFGAPVAHKDHPRHRAGLSRKHKEKWRFERPLTLILTLICPHRRLIEMLPTAGSRMADFFYSRFMGRRFFWSKVLAGPAGNAAEGGWRGLAGQGREGRQPPRLFWKTLFC
jgi:hypothetical protein